MKVLIPVNQGDSSDRISESLFNTSRVYIYDRESNSGEVIAVSEISRNPENISIALKIRGILEIITNDLPVISLKLFRESGLKVFKAQGFSIDENISLHLNNKLKVFEYEWIPASGSCSGSCHSCSDSECN